MRTSFKPEYFILLEPSEMERLVSSRNRKSFQPELTAFLHAVDMPRELRALSFESRELDWTPPGFAKDGQDSYLDDAGNVRGHRYAIALPARPGEPQMALSYEWFWSEFCRFLHLKKIWAYKEESEFVCIVPENREFSLENEWRGFWRSLSSETHLKKSVQLFLDNKTLFKNQAKPWDSNDIPILSSEMANFLIAYYRHGKSKNRHFKKQSIPKAIADLEEILKNKTFDSIPLPSALDQEFFPGGDFNPGSKRIPCAACGQPVSKKDTLERKAVFLKDSDERPQSALDKDKLSRYCKRCVATVFLCPVKLTPETLTVRFGAKNIFIENAVRLELRKYVAQSLNVHAGSFVSLHIQEYVNRKPLNQVWGSYHYSLWKMAVVFPPALFAQDFSIEVFPGEESFALPAWSLWFVSSLAQWDSVFKRACYMQKEKRTPFSQFLRLVSRKRVFQAFYVLISGQVVNTSYDRSWKMNALQEIWSKFEKVMTQYQNFKKEEKMPIPDYPKIAGFAGLLLPLAERVQSAKKEEDKKVAVGKILEEVDRPIQYAYTAARESGSTDFIFVKRPNNRFFFEKAVELLDWAGEDVDLLKEEGDKKAAELIKKEKEAFAWLDKADEKLFICSDQIARVTAALVSEGEKPYENEADWRAFAYQVKLALWSMFPRYLGSREKSEQ